jgi:hypothetical protein
MGLADGDPAIIGTQNPVGADRETMDPAAADAPRPPVAAGSMRRLALALPAWSADPHVVAFCQSLVTAVGVLGSAVLLRRLLQPDLGRWLLLSVLAGGLGVAGRALVAA